MKESSLSENQHSLLHMEGFDDAASIQMWRPPTVKCQSLKRGKRNFAMNKSRNRSIDSVLVDLLVQGSLEHERYEARKLLKQAAERLGNSVEVDSRAGILQCRVSAGLKDKVEARKVGVPLRRGDKQQASHEKGFDQRVRDLALYIRRYVYVVCGWWSPSTLL
jgi:hypothetical protein